LLKNAIKADENQEVSGQEGGGWKKCRSLLSPILSCFSRQKAKRTEYNEAKLGREGVDRRTEVSVAALSQAELGTRKRR